MVAVIINIDLLAWFLPVLWAFVQTKAGDRVDKCRESRSACIAIADKSNFVRATFTRYKIKASSTTFTCNTQTNYYN